MSSYVFVVPFRTALNSNGVAIAGGQAVITATGTTTLSTVYTDTGLSVAGENPIVADAAGRFPTRYLDNSLTYRLRIFDADADIATDDPIEDIDPYDPREVGTVLEPEFSVATGAAGSNVLISGTYPNLLLTIPRGSPGVTTGADWGSVGGTLADQTDLQTALNLKAPLASPTLTGTPAAPTAAGNTNTTQIATTAMVQAALAQNLVQSIFIPASAMVAQTTNGAAVGLSETSSNDIMVSTLDFDASTIEYAQFQIAMPKSWNEGTVTAQFLWSASNTGDVVWGFQGVAISNDDVLDAAFGTAQTVTDSVTATTDLMTSAATSAVTIGGSPAAEDLVVFRAYRNASSGSDTCAVDAKLIGVRLFFTTNAADDS